MTTRAKSRNAAALALMVPLMLAVGGGCNGRTPAEVEVRVRQVSFDPTTGSPVVLLEDVENSVALPIWIGPAEAQAIALEMEHVRPPRPLTHDLMKEVLQRAGVEMQRVVIHDLREGTYYAQARFRTRRGTIVVDSRPSDAIALALRFDSPIFVAKALLQEENVIAVAAGLPPGTGRIGGVLFQEITEDLAEHFGVAAGSGLLVADAPAGAEGVQRGDVVVEVEGHRVSDLGELRRELGRRSGPVHLTVVRGGRTIQVRFRGFRRAGP